VITTRSRKKRKKRRRKSNIYNNKKRDLYISEIPIPISNLQYWKKKTSRGEKSLN
jgi:hypothetical protein